MTRETRFGETLIYTHDIAIGHTTPKSQSHPLSLSPHTKSAEAGPRRRAALFEYRKCSKSQTRTSIVYTSYTRKGAFGPQPSMPNMSPALTNVRRTAQ